AARPAEGDEGGNRPPSAPAAPRAATPQPSLLDAPAPAPRPVPTATAPGSPPSAPSSVERASTPARPTVESAEPVDLGTGWARATEEILRKKALLGSVVQHGVPVRLEGGVLTVALVASPFHREMLNDRANRERITHAGQQHIPGARRVEISTEAGASGGAVNHPAVQAAVAMFQGEVVAVRPRAPEEGESL